MHRAHLLGTLFRSLPPGTVNFGAFIKSAASLNADLLVGADGIHSQVRREVFEHGRYMGYRSHRLVMDNVADVRRFTEYLGRGQRIGLVPISERRLYVWTTFNSPRHEQPVPDLPRMFSQFTHEPVRYLFAPAAAAPDHHDRHRGALGRYWTRDKAVRRRLGARHDAEHRPGRRHGDGRRRGARRRARRQ